MEAAQITTRKIYEQVAELIKQQIADGHYEPGDKLPSAKELSERFQVGRSTIREALSALKAMGLVETHQGEGTYVKEVTAAELTIPGLQALTLNKDTVLELIEARKALEVANAALAAEKRDDADLEQMEATLTLMKEHLGSEAEGEQADIRFHLALARATHNSIMERLLETISTQMEIAIRETRRLQMYANRSVSEQLWREHEEIYEAVKAKDAALAQDRMKQHLFHVEKVLVRFLKA